MKNFAVITRVQLIRMQHSRIPSYKFSKINLSDIPMTGYNLVTIEGIKPHSSSFSETEKISNAGSYFEKKLKMEISKLRPGVSLSLDRFANGQIAAVITDANGYTHLVFPLKRTIKREIPGTAKGANTTEIEFSGEGLFESPFVY